MNRAQYDGKYCAKHACNISWKMVLRIRKIYISQMSCADKEESRELNEMLWA